MVTEAAELGRRERKKMQTRRSLEEAAWKLFLEKGFDETTVDDITEAVDVSQRTFFRHFPSKEAVLFSDVEDQLVAFQEAIRSRPNDEPLGTAIKEAMLRVASDFEARRLQHILRTKLVEQAPNVASYGRQVIYQGWHATLRDEAARRLGVKPDRDLRPNVYAGAAIAALEAALDRWVSNDGEGDLAEIVHEALDIVDAGFSQ